MDPMHVIAAQYTDGLARRHAAAGWSTRPSRSRSLLRRIGNLARPLWRTVVGLRPRRPQRSTAISSIGGRRAYPRAQSG